MKAASDKWISRQVWQLLRDERRETRGRGGEVCDQIRSDVSDDEKVGTSGRSLSQCRLTHHGPYYASSGFIPNCDTALTAAAPHSRPASRHIGRGITCLGLSAVLTVSTLATHRVGHKTSAVRQQTPLSPRIPDGQLLDFSTRKAAVSLVHHADPRLLPWKSLSAEGSARVGDRRCWLPRSSHGGAAAAVRVS